MNDNEMAILDSLKQAIDVLLEHSDAQQQRIDALENELGELRTVFVEGIINPGMRAMEEADREARFNEFNDKYGEKLTSYDEPLKAISGEEDYSLAQNIFDSYEDEEEPKPELDSYVEEAIQKAEARIDSLREMLGVSPDKEVEVVQDGEGNTEVKVDGETVATEDGVVEETAEEPSEEKEEEPAEDKPVADEDGQMEMGFDEIVDDDGEEEVSDPDELKRYEEELSKYVR